MNPIYFAAGFIVGAIMFKLGIRIERKRSRLAIRAAEISADMRMRNAIADCQQTAIFREGKIGLQNIEAIRKARKEGFEAGLERGLSSGRLVDRH